MLILKKEAVRLSDSLVKELLGNNYFTINFVLCPCRRHT